MSEPLKNKFATFNSSPKAQAQAVNHTIKTAAHEFCV